MSKILVEVFVPAAASRSDVLIPYECKFFEAATLVRTLLGTDPNGRFEAGEDAVVCDALTGEVLNVNLSAQELGLKNGSRLVLI